MHNNLSPNYLPIAKYNSLINQLIAQHPVTVISGKTGCGKSTQIPQFILQECPTARIAICQPRRIAATSLAVRVSQEMGCVLGRKVGYHIGMQSFRQQNCSIVYMTYGILIQQLLFQESLSYTHIILDEIHERTLQMDFTFVAMKNILNGRYKEKIKLVIMSATLNSEQFAQYFATDEAHSFFIPQIMPLIKQTQTQPPKRGGRQRAKRNSSQQGYTLTKKGADFRSAVTFQVNEDKQYSVIQYFLEDIKGNCQFYATAEGQQFIPEQAYKTGLDIIMKQRHAQHLCDILVFLPGLFQIRTLKRQLQALQVSSAHIIEVHSLFSEELYAKLFDKNIPNKVILATNIGQSSITLPFCKVVIDFCLSRKNYSKTKGITRLQTRLASQASLTQRSGRVGRVSDGIVYRMISKDLYKTLARYEQPEIQCVCLEMVILKVKQMDTMNNNSVFRNPYNFLMMTINPPEIADIKEALDELIKEDALIGQPQCSSAIQHSSSLSLTQVGMFMVSMPCDLQISKMMLMGLKIGIPFVIIRISSIIMCTKTFFVHEQRRFCMQNFMHYLIQYDNQTYNDYLLRERMYVQWRTQFYDKFKKAKKRQNPNNMTTNSSKQKKNTHFQGLIKSESGQNEQNLSILQQFNQERWSKQQLEWCKFRGVNLNAMREIIRIEQGIKYRLSSFNLQQTSNETISNELILLCLDYGFPFNDLEISWKSHQSLSANNTFTFELPAHPDYDIPLIHDYLRPEKHYKVEPPNHQQNYLIQGNASAMCKLILPSVYVQGNFEKTSSIFYHLNKKKLNHQFKSQITYRRTPTSIFSDSINKACIPPHPKKNYRLLTHRFTEIKYKKMVQMCALIEEEMLHRMQIITMKEVKMCLHPSGQFYSKYRIQGTTYDFKSYVGQKQIKVIKEMRRIARREKNNKIYSNQQQMTPQDIQLLLKLITRNEHQEHKEQPWEYYYLIENNYSIDYKFHPIESLPPLANSTHYQHNYNQWKHLYYYKFIRFYRCLIMEHCYLICKDCLPQEIKEIQEVHKYSPLDSRLALNEYSGNWLIKQDSLYCKGNHLIGKVVNEDYAELEKSKLKVYLPFNIIQDLWTQWPTKAQIYHRIGLGKQLIQDQKLSINKFECYFCYSYNEVSGEQQRKQFYKSELKHVFWKKVMQHFRNIKHMNNVNLFYLSLRPS